LIEVVKQERSAKKQLQQQIRTLMRTVQSVGVEESFHGSLVGIMEQSGGNAAEFVQLFWKEQQKMFKRKESGKVLFPTMTLPH
jgi:uncharacterized protein involved in propanediol utilization